MKMSLQKLTVLVGLLVLCAAPELLAQDVRPDTIYIERTVKDTVYVRQAPEITEKDYRDYIKKRRDYNLQGKRMLLALRTNILAVPLANIGVEVPINEHWSVGADLYYPWLWRKDHSQGIDAQGWCFQLQALDIEGRYWFNNSQKKPQQRLLGHSVGVYAAAGQYDFEQNFSGHQGEFYNVGVDYLYACPIFGGRLHLEFELGIGYIYSPAQPYDTFVPGEKAFRRKGVTQYTRWFGPTRAQVSLVWPIYVNVKKGGAR